jgi:hypothetical protein
MDNAQQYKYCKKYFMIGGLPAPILIRDLQNTNNNATATIFLQESMKYINTSDTILS